MWLNRMLTTSAFSFVYHPRYDFTVDTLMYLAEVALAPICILSSLPQLLKV